MEISTSPWASRRNKARTAMLAKLPSRRRKDAEKNDTPSPHIGDLAPSSMENALPLMMTPTKKSTQTRSQMRKEGAPRLERRVSGISSNASSMDKENDLPSNFGRGRGNSIGGFLERSNSIATPTKQKRGQHRKRAAGSKVKGSLQQQRESIRNRARVVRGERTGGGTASGSDSENVSSSDDVYPTQETNSIGSAFSDKLSLFSPQKKVFKGVNRDDVVDVVFSELFTKKATLHANAESGDTDESTTDTEPNEEFVKRGLDLSIFKDGSKLFMDANISKGNVGKEILDRYVTVQLINTLATDMRFEDFRVSSARFVILRAIHKNCSQKRVALAKALADCTQLRLEYVSCVQELAHLWEVETGNVVQKKEGESRHDHGHGYTELLRFLIEHVGEGMNGFKNHGSEPLSSKDTNILLECYIRTLLSLLKAHCIDTLGTDEDELVDCAGQFVAYIPTTANRLLENLLRCWPARNPSQQVFFIRLLARVMMAGPRLPLAGEQTTLHIRIFRRLAKCITHSHINVSKEALAFTNSQFVLNQYVAYHSSIYEILSKALHENIKSHWSNGIQEVSEQNFDTILDFAP